MADTKEKTPIKRLRNLSADQIFSHIQKQTLSDKITLLNQLKGSIDADKKVLEEQLSLITKLN